MSTAIPIRGIDSHAHIFHPALPMVADRRYDPDYAANLEEWFTLQNAAGLSHGVLIQPSFLGTDNSAIEGALEAHPGRLRAIAVVDPDVPDVELDRLVILGFVGIRLNLIGRDPDDYTTSEWQRLFLRLVSRRWQVEIQCGFEDLAGIVPVIAGSGVTVVIDHFGLPQGGIDPVKPSHRDILDLLGVLSTLWVKLSAPYRSGLDATQSAASFAHLRRACGGIDRFVWGSDWPHTQHEASTTYAGQIAQLTDLVPDRTERAQILRGNPAALFHFS